jgi:uroporphyrinogen-III synthase
MARRTAIRTITLCTSSDVGPAVSDELKSHGLRTDIYPAEDAFFMRPLISAMAASLGKKPPRAASSS